MFDSIIGQERAKDALASMLAAGRVPGTLLFAGPYGVGKSETAFELARQLLCEQGPAADCHSCSACERARKLEHPDLHVLFPFRRPPEGSAYGTWVEQFVEHRELLAREPYAPVTYEKSREIVVDLVEEVRERLQESALEGGRKVCVILCAHRLNRKTGNMLLKILEEPPEDVHFILTTDRLQEMLPTIVSRASIIRFRRLTKDEIISYLRDNGAAGDIASLSPAVLDEGSLKTAKAFLSGGRADLLGRAFELFEAVAGGDEGMVIEGAYTFMRSRDSLEAEELINGFAQYTRYIVAYKAGTLDRSSKYPAGVPRLSEAADFRSLDRLAGLFGRGLGMLGRNVSVSMVLTPILYGIHDTF